MERPRTRRMTPILGPAILFCFYAESASAHHPEISAVAVCDDNDELVIEYTATAWASVNLAKRANPQVDVLVNTVE